MKKIAILLTTLLLLSSITNAQEIVKGKAINVYDGDTFTLLAENSDKIRIRVVGIDAPEAKQEYGLTSRNYARKILDGKQVTVYMEPGETYGRKLGVVITEDGLHFNYEMVASGNAWWYEGPSGKYSKDKFLKAAFEKAKANKLGLWSKNDQIAPWEWRKENR